MWLLTWLSDRWSRVWNILEGWWGKAESICYYWYSNVKWAIVDSWTPLTNVLYYWYANLQWLFTSAWGYVTNVCYHWYAQIQWIVVAGYTYITNVCYWWYAQVQWIVVTGYTYITNVCYYWYNALQNLAVTWYDNLRVLQTIFQDIKDIFLTTWLWELKAFLSNPGAYLWAYIIGLAEDKLSELLDVYW